MAYHFSANASKTCAAGSEGPDFIGYSSGLQSKLELPIDSLRKPHQGPIRAGDLRAFSGRGLRIAYKQQQFREPQHSRRRFPHQTFAPGIHSGLGVIGQMQFAKDVADMALDRILADHELGHDVGIAQTVGDQFLEFPFHGRSIR